MFHPNILRKESLNYETEPITRGIEKLKSVVVIFHAKYYSFLYNN